MNPIIEKDGKWYFIDETWSKLYGPYDTKKEAEVLKHLSKYTKHINNHQDEEDINFIPTDDEKIKILNITTSLMFITTIIGGFVSKDLSTAILFDCIIILMSFISILIVAYRNDLLWE